MKFYKNIHEISVFTFYKIIDEDNVNYLIKKYKSSYEDKISPKLKNLLKETFENIVSEFNAINADSKTIKSLRLKFEIDYLTVNYETAIEAINLYNSTNVIDFLFILNDLELGFIFNSEKNVEKQISIVLKKLKSLKMKIKIKKSKYDREFNKVKKQKEKYLPKIYKKALLIEKALDLKYPINIQKTNLYKWCTLIDLTLEKTKTNG